VIFISTRAYTMAAKREITIEAIRNLQERIINLLSITDAVPIINGNSKKASLPDKELSASLKSIEKKKPIKTII
jgi:hypothetical protein